MNYEEKVFYLNNKIIEIKKSIENKEKAYKKYIEYCIYNPQYLCDDYESDLRNLYDKLERYNRKLARAQNHLLKN